jgi:glucose/arabinose dehydrogenase/mono/diheme cytochrome c family protein
MPRSIRFPFSARSHSGLLYRATLLGLVLAAGLLALASGSAPSAAAGDSCPDNAGISLPPGFCATIFADNIGHARHLAVAANGVVYVNTWNNRLYGGTPPAGGFLVALQDTNGDGKADKIVRFGTTAAEGGAGGTGIGLYNGYVYAEADGSIVRYKLPETGIAPEGGPEIVVFGLPVTGDHPMHPFAIDSQGNLFIDVASATNACQAQNRIAGSPGLKPCIELETRGGIWRYDANKTGQVFSPAQRYATGIRNADGVAIDPGFGLFATQQGRDQLHDNWPKLYTPDQGANLPAEELLRIEQGGDYGWPECYFDNSQNKLVLAPEYGGDGGKTVGVCASKLEPAAVFPAHWAPNDLAFYTGSQFPTAYQGGAFIAFHGSWNRAPSPQGGYNVVFQPMQGGKKSGPYVVFADGFAGAVKEPAQAAHRPSGVAVGPDGALYVADDRNGRIWRITFSGDRTAPVMPAAQPEAQASKSAVAAPPAGVNPNPGAASANAGAASAIDVNTLPVPPRATKQQIALGAKVFAGQVGRAGCSSCHGSEAQGTPQGPNLTNGHWLWGDGSPGAIRRIVYLGVPKPKNYPDVMPAKGGGTLTNVQVTAVADYVWALSHRH